MSAILPHPKGPRRWRAWPTASPFGCPSRPKGGWCFPKSRGIFSTTFFATVSAAFRNRAWRAFPPGRSKLGATVRHDYVGLRLARIPSTSPCLGRKRRNTFKAICEHGLSHRMRRWEGNRPSRKDRAAAGSLEVNQVRPPSSGLRPLASNCVPAGELGLILSVSWPDAPSP